MDRDVASPFAHDHGPAAYARILSIRAELDDDAGSARVAIYADRAARLRGDGPVEIRRYDLAGAELLRLVRGLTGGDTEPPPAPDPEDVTLLPAPSRG